MNAGDFVEVVVAGQLERELGYYRRECNDLGGRLLRLQEEQSQAFREARRSRTVAKLIREVHRSADSGLTPEELGGPFLEIIVENTMCDRAALLAEAPVGSGDFVVTHHVGQGASRERRVTVPAPPPFFFTSGQTPLATPAFELTEILQLPYILWAFDAPSGHALIIGNRSEANVSRAFEAGDQELIEGGLSVYLDVLARKRAEMQLRLAMRAAEEANQAKAAFLATLTHELRTPLDCIIGYAELMSAGRRPGLTLVDCAGYARQIDGSARHLLGLINDILDFSRMARGQLPLQLDWVRLEGVIEGAVHAASALAEKRQVSLTVQPFDPDLGILIDSRRFRQILDNILSNAIKFTRPEGRVEVQVAREPDSSVAVIVRDTGVGMRSHDIPRALEPFLQIENAMTRSVTGTGLGLPIARGLVEAHSGRFAIESELGRGTTVTIALPPDRVHRGDRVIVAN